MRRLLFLAAIFLLSFPAWRFAEAAVLKGQVLLIGAHNEITPAVGVEVTLLETGDSVRTKAEGLFRLFLPDVLKAGERVRLSVVKKDWVIHYPLGGETLIPADLAKTIVPIRLLPKGSKRLWSDERIERFIQDTAEQAKQQVKLEGRSQDIDFSRYIKDWATELGFSVYEAKAEIDRWVAGVEQKPADFYQLGLAAYAKKHFGKANRLFTESAETKVKQREKVSQSLQELSRKREMLTEEIVRDFRLAGDAAYNDYAFPKSLVAYQRALNNILRDERPPLWAAIISDVGRANYEIGIRAEGWAAHEHLNAAVSAYRSALEVYTRAQLPQDWAMTQNNLGIALWEQGLRTGGEEGRRLLTEAMAACQGALVVFKAARMQYHVDVTENNLRRVEQALESRALQNTIR